MKKFVSYKTWLNEAKYEPDMFVELGYFNERLSLPIKKEYFKDLVEKAKIKEIQYSSIPNIIMRYDEDFKKIIKSKKSEKELIEYWKPRYLKMKKFEKQKQSDEYYYNLVDAIKQDKISDPIIILSINDETNKNYRFICGGRNRVILSYILKKPIKSILIKLPEQKKEDIKKIISDRNND